MVPAPAGEYIEPVSGLAGRGNTWCCQVHRPWVLERGTARLGLLQQRLHPEARRGHHALPECREGAEARLLLCGDDAFRGNPPTIHVFPPASEDEEGPACLEPGTRPPSVTCSQDAPRRPEQGQSWGVSGHRSRVHTCVQMCAHRHTRCPHDAGVKAGVRAEPGW